MGEQLANHRSNHIKKAEKWIADADSDCLYEFDDPRQVDYLLDNERFMVDVRYRDVGYVLASAPDDC